MKNLNLLEKFIFLINSICAVLLLFSYLLPYIPPHIFPALSVLSLLLPVLLIINFLFFLFWLFKAKRQLLLSAVILALGITHIFSLIRFGGGSDTKQVDTLTLLTYNVRQFNVYGWVEEANVGKRAIAFIEDQNPDIVCLQEYHPDFELDAKKYPFKHKVMRPANSKFGQVIFSKFPIVHSGSLDFGKKGNNGIYADIKVGEDTIRAYNMHFQSFRLSPSLNNLQKENSKKLLGRLGVAFEKQEDQVKKFLQSEAASPHKVIVAGDFNNSATSYMYRKVRGDKVDAFAKAGSGTGATFWFDIIPLRIDFILADEQLEVLDFETYGDIDLSDHKSSMATFKRLSQ
ncbi:endonuclease/exonuclease/phosphatase family protein [uncultured Dokdonia sp.]|uniref:endonuclease/exonuclease/phosphatase family protein n=1 Tax=uncultured Dokdonia sp. TaxID=575653 RepID=UPI00260CC8F4|nr:endonuclease/exonuclease/phosphatase family protein [uncultured Dokdonia sp.]